MHIFWLREESLEESDNLPDPDVLAQEVVEGLEATLKQFREIAPQEVVASMLDLGEISNGDVLRMNKRISELLLTVIAN